MIYFLFLDWKERYLSQEDEDLFFWNEIDFFWKCVDFLMLNWYGKWWLECKFMEVFSVMDGGFLVFVWWVIEMVQYGQRFWFISGVFLGFFISLFSSFWVIFYFLLRGSFFFIFKGMFVYMLKESLVGMFNFILLFSFSVGGVFWRVWFNFIKNSFLGLFCFYCWKL